MDEETFYTIPEAAEKLRVKRDAIYKWIAQGKMDVVYVGSDRRITGAELNAFVQRSTAARKARHSTRAVQSDDIRTPGHAEPSLVTA